MGRRDPSGRRNRSMRREWRQAADLVLAVIAASALVPLALRHLVGLV